MPRKKRPENYRQLIDTLDSSARSAALLLADYLDGKIRLSATKLRAVMYALDRQLGSPRQAQDLNIRNEFMTLSDLARAAAEKWERESIEGGADDLLE